MNTETGNEYYLCDGWSGEGSFYTIWTESHVGFVNLTEKDLQDMLDNLQNKKQRG